MTEALAELWHKRIREEWGFVAEDGPSLAGLFRQKYRGSRYSWGYPACPDLDDQAKLVELLEVDRIGVVLTEEFQLEPEQSTSAIIVPAPRGEVLRRLTAARLGHEPARGQPAQLPASDADDLLELLERRRPSGVSALVATVDELLVVGSRPPCGRDMHRAIRAGTPPRTMSDSTNARVAANSSASLGRVRRRGARSCPGSQAWSSRPSRCERRPRPRASPRSTRGARRRCGGCPPRRDR